MKDFLLAIRKIISDFLSISEYKKSIICVVLLAITAFGIYSAYFKLNVDLPPNVTTIILTLSTVIGGVNLTNSLPDIISSVRNTISSFSNNKSEVVESNESKLSSTTTSSPIKAEDVFK